MKKRDADGVSFRALRVVQADGLAAGLVTGLLEGLVAGLVSGLVAGLVAGFVTGDETGPTVGAPLPPVLLLHAPTNRAAAMMSAANNDFMGRPPWGVVTTLGGRGARQACGHPAFPLQADHKGRLAERLTCADATCP
jgi:hypothetical protein